MTERRNQIINGLHELPGQIKKILTMDASFKQLAAGTLGKQTSLLIMGRGYQHSTCLEAALKIKELTYLHSEGMRSNSTLSLGRPYLSLSPPRLGNQVSSLESSSMVPLP